MSKRAKPAACAGCPYAELPDTRYCGSEGEVDADVVVLAENPGQTEAESGRPLHPEGKTGKEVREATAAFEARGGKVFYANVRRCITPKNDWNTRPADYAASVEHCTRTYLEPELRALTKPSVRLVCLGKHALKQVLGQTHVQRFAGSHWTRVEVDELRRVVNE